MKSSKSEMSICQGLKQSLTTICNSPRLFWRMDWMQWGSSHRKTVINRSVILLKGEVLTIGAVTLLKKATHTLRPDGSTYNSIPSGHTAQVFADPTFLSEEYKDRYKWMPYVSYTIASSVGLLRVTNNRHYIRYVLVGAGIGYLSMKAAYWTHKYKWGKKPLKTR